VRSAAFASEAVVKLTTAKVLMTLASARGLEMYGQQLGRHLDAYNTGAIYRELELLQRLGWVTSRRERPGPVDHGGRRFWRLTVAGERRAAVVINGGYVKVRPVPREPEPVDWSVRCLCRLELRPPPPNDRWSWWPNRDPEPEHVRAVVRYGQLSALYAAVRQSNGRWLARNERATRPWREVGLCWAGNPHMVVEVLRLL
jgi:DNA-binding PadR family transcriptional regulator